MHVLDELPLSTHLDAASEIEKKLNNKQIPTTVIEEMVMAVMREETTITFNGTHHLNEEGTGYYKGGIQIQYKGKRVVGAQEAPVMIIRCEDLTFYIPEIVLHAQSGISIGDVIDSNFEFIRRFFVTRSQIQYFDRFKLSVWALAFKPKLEAENISFKFTLSNKFGVYRYNKDKKTGEFYHITYDQAKEIVRIATQISNGKF